MCGKLAEKTVHASFDNNDVTNRMGYYRFYIAFRL